MHWVIASLVPDTVTARSVELGNISEATTTEAPVISRISLIFDPPLPISEPHCEAGMIRRRVMGGRGMLVPANGPPTSCNPTSFRLKSFQFTFLFARFSFFPPLP